MKNNNNFDDFFTYQNTILKQKEKPVKRIPLEKYIELCKKEDVIYFLADHAPITYSSRKIPKRKDSHFRQDDYEVKILQEQLVNVPFRSESYDKKNNNKLAINYIEKLVKLWEHGKADYRESSERIGFSWTSIFVLTFYFNKKWINEKIKEWEDTYE